MHVVPGDGWLGHGEVHVVDAWCSTVIDRRHALMDWTCLD